MLNNEIQKRQTDMYRDKIKYVKDEQKVEDYRKEIQEYFRQQKEEYSQQRKEEYRSNEKRRNRL